MGDCMFKVIICDDEVLARKKLQSSINWEKLDFEVVAMFKDGEEAFEYLKENPVDVVLTDIKMPKLNGVELSKIIYEQFPDTKVVIFSAYRDFEYAKKAVHYHVFDYILKPINYDEFYITLENLRTILANQKIPNQFHSHNIYSQRSDYFSEAFLHHDELENLSLKLKKTNLYIDLTKSLCAHIKITITNFDEIVNNTWKYSKILLNNVFTNILTPETPLCCYTLLTLHKNVLEIFAVSKTSMNMEAFQKEIQNFCISSINTLNKNFELLAEYDIVQKCNSINEIDSSKSSIFHTYDNNDSNDSNDFIDTVIKYINEHYMEDITLDEIASKLYMNPCKISQMLKKHTNETYINFITNLRIKKAKQLLKDTDIKISLIGEMVGYKYDKYFYKVFKNYVGISPNEYRKNFS